MFPSSEGLLFQSPSQLFQHLIFASSPFSAVYARVVATPIPIFPRTVFVFTVSERGGPRPIPHWERWVIARNGFEPRGEICLLVYLRHCTKRDGPIQNMHVQKILTKEKWKQGNKQKWLGNLGERLRSCLRWWLTSSLNWAAAFLRGSATSNARSFFFFFFSSLVIIFERNGFGLKWEAGGVCWNSLGGIVTMQPLADGGSRRELPRLSFFFPFFFFFDNARSKSREAQRSSLSL